MAKLRATPGKPTASTVETVNVLNGSKKGVGTNFLRKRSEPPSSMPRVEQPKETLTRTSPKKRKEPPTAVAGSSKLRRVTRASDARVEATVMGTSSPQQQSSSQPANVGRRQSVYDPPEANVEKQTAATATAPAPRKRVQLTRKGAKDPFQGHHDVGLPESSPAKGTRSHDKNRKSTTSRRNDPKEASQMHSKKRLPNIMAQAAKQVEEAESVEPEEPEASPRKGPGPSPIARSRRSGRPSKGGKDRPGQQPTRETVSATREPQSQPNADQADTIDEEAQESANESPSDAEPEPLRKSQKETANSGMEAEVIAGLEDAVSLYSCRSAWTKVLVYAKKAVQPSTSIKLKDMRAVLSTIKGIKLVYQKIYKDEISKEDLDEAEEEIEDKTEQLKELLVKIAAADPKEHDLTFVECIHEQVVPRIALLMTATLATRFHERDKTISIDSLEELVGLINIALAFRDLADKARNKPANLINGEGELILGMAASAVSGLRSIRRKYSTIITDQRIAVERAKDARRREAEIARNFESTAAMQQQRLQEKAKAYKRKLQEERERNAEAARKSELRRVEEERRWKQGLMSNRSFEAERLRKKFGLPYRPAVALDVAPRVQRTVMDIDDIDFDEDFESTRSRPTQLRPNGVNHPRPRPRREPTEEIPAPVVEPEWTDEQTTALTWGLQAFRGPDRYRNILHAPEVRGILNGKNDFDLMQQALYIKQSMARALDTGTTLNGEPLNDDWSWLRSV